MSSWHDANVELVLTGLDGSNPLAFLAAVGTLRTLAFARRGHKAAQMRWRVENSALRPELSAPGLSRQLLVEVLHRELCGTSDHPHLGLGKNLSVPPAHFLRHAHAAGESGSRRWCDFVASFGSEVLRHAKLDRIQQTEFCFVSGSGHQHYLATMAELLRQIQPDHLHCTLFEEWRYGDNGLSLRWDPIEAREHAYRWTAPGDETTRTMWGANLLAAEGSAMFPTVPPSHGANPTTGWTSHGGELFFRWPIWKPYVSVDTLRSLLADAALKAPATERAALRAMGVVEVYQCRKVKLGEGANFKWSFTPARAVL